MAKERDQHKEAMVRSLIDQLYAANQQLVRYDRIIHNLLGQLKFLGYTDEDLKNMGVEKLLSLDYNLDKVPVKPIFIA